MSSAPRGLAPCEGLGFVLMKMGRVGPPFEPRHRPQAGKSGDPRSQNTDRPKVLKGSGTRVRLPVAHYSDTSWALKVGN